MSDVHQDHVQTALFAPSAIEVVLRCGIVQSQDHAQFQVEVRSATDGTLIDMWSHPHCPLGKADDGLAGAVRELQRAVSYWANPFP